MIVTHFLLVHPALTPGKQAEPCRCGPQDISLCHPGTDPRKRAGLVTQVLTPGRSISMVNKVLTPTQVQSLCSLDHPSLMVSHFYGVSSRVPSPLLEGRAPLCP